MSSDVSEYRGNKPESMGKERLGAWIYAVLMMIVIMISLPLAPILWRAALKAFGSGLNAFGYLLFCAVFLGFAVHMVRSPAKLGFSAVLLLVAFALVYFCLLKFMCRFPADRVHLVEYGLLALLLHRALRLDFSKGKAYMFAFLIAAGFGIFDESIQYLLPNRVFEVRDIITNTLAAGLSLLAVALLIRRNPVKTRSNQAGACP